MYLIIIFLVFPAFFGEIKMNIIPYGNIGLEHIKVTGRIMQEEQVGGRATATTDED